MVPCIDYQLCKISSQGDQNILVNVFFSLGMGLALLVMGIDIDLDQVMEAIRWEEQSDMIGQQPDFWGLASSLSSP